MAKNTARKRRSEARIFSAERAKVTFESNMSAYIDKLQKDLTDSILSQASYVGAKLFYDGMLRNVPVADGTLRDSIFHFFDKQYLSIGKAVWLIGPNKKKAPHWYNVEYGHPRVNVVYRDKGTGELKPTRKRLKVPKQVTARPYFRPAYYQNIGAAQSGTMARFKELIHESLNT